MKLTPKTLENTIKEIRKQQKSVNRGSNPPIGFLLPICKSVLNKERYRGKGRPRGIDYDSVEIDWFN